MKSAQLKQENVIITATGLYTPPYSISNEELVVAFNTYVDKFNTEHHQEIEKGECHPLLFSDADFIEKASGIKSRYVMDKEGILNPDIMAPRFKIRNDDEYSIQCDMAYEAASDALEKAHLKGSELDLVIMACSNFERPYPGMSIELQQRLGAPGYGVDMNVACASALFGLMHASNAIKSGAAKNVLVVNPEICSAQLNFRDRDSHFIFGDAATAIVVQHQDMLRVDSGFKINSIECKTEYSSKIRNNFGFLLRTRPETRETPDKLFYQDGRKVFKEVTSSVSEFLSAHLEKERFLKDNLKRLWLHQANVHMNELISKKLLAREARPDEAPLILNEYANTSSAGSIIAFHQYHKDLKKGDIGLLSAFGAGYSMGCALLEKT